ncbi:hypothetical protein TSUD_248160 [Trifolium subterraneum]|uniref:Uncharacterized protein n=1 Tax=Trifolium subterraneum TaxID=3900 RepID=A0A2Z6MPB4_TRISU|nr:hypothetical protein TSUD_248160 [Trifolium subterraneum]
MSNHNSIKTFDWTFDTVPEEEPLQIKGGKLLFFIAIFTIIILFTQSSSALVGSSVTAAFSINLTRRHTQLHFLLHHKDLTPKISRNFRSYFIKLIIPIALWRKPNVVSV